MGRIDIEKAMDNLLIKSKGELLSRIEQVSSEISIEGTKSVATCYMLKIDANGNTRLKDLVDFIDRKLIEYSIPKKEIDEAKEYFIETGSPSKVDELKSKAKTLFTELDKTGEGGEILLYILIQEFLKLPQLISKMSLKTSGNFHYNGADGVHVEVDTENDNLNLYWGESKMYADLSQAISSCFTSIKGFILDAQGHSSTQARDLQLITSNINANVNDANLENYLVRFFDKDDNFSNNVVYKGVCFIGFDHDSYPSVDDLTKTNELVRQLIVKEINGWCNSIFKGIVKHKNLELKEIHVFLMPFPSVEEFRKCFLNKIQ